MPETNSKLAVSVLILAPSISTQSILSKNQLQRARDSASFADEVIIVEHTEPITDFAKARNNAMDHAKYDWVFFLDSDEWFAVGADDAIAELLSDKHIAGLCIRRIDVFHNKILKYGETGQHFLLRFMRKDKSCFVRPVHEFAQVMGCVKNNNLTIWHEGHHDINDFIKSIARYSNLEAEWQIESDPKISRVKVILQMVTYPVGKFLLNYIWKGGIFDGWHGLVYAVVMSLHSLFVRIFLLEKINQNSNK